MDEQVQDSTATLQTFIIEWLGKIGLSGSVEGIAYIFAGVIAIIAIAIVSLVLMRVLLKFKVLRLVMRSKNTWDDMLLEAGVFRRFAHIVPGFVVYSLYPTLFTEEQSVYPFFAFFSAAYLLFAIWRTLSAVLTAVEEIYSQSRMAKKAPITGFIQVARLLLTLILVFLTISLLLGKSPIYLLSGLTAIAAVLLLIFRDTILGFVAGIQIAANRMFNTGDWIEMPKFGVDGEILLIGLNVVKVQNWDKTISTIPTYALTSDAVKNWRGMSESGGRRIKRAIQIDIHSVGFANADDIENWKKFKLLKTYLAQKEKDIEQDSSTQHISKEDMHNQRRLTNLGTFRAYITEYIKQHGQVNHELTHMVRQLKPTEVGIPIEVYCFCKQKDWVTYEQVQADIFDHLLSVLPLFNLLAYERVGNVIEPRAQGH